MKTITELSYHIDLLYKIQMLHYCRIQTDSSIYQELPDFSIKMRTHFCATDCSPLEGVSRYRFVAPPAGRVTPPFACQPSIKGTTSQNNLTQRVTVYSLHILPYTHVSASYHFPALISTTVSYRTFISSQLASSFSLSGDLLPPLITALIVFNFVKKCRANLCHVS